MVNTLHNIQNLYGRTVHLNPIYFINQCHPYEFNRTVKNTYKAFIIESLFPFYSLLHTQYMLFYKGFNAGIAV